jgi:hypothetical protein
VHLTSQLFSLFYCTHLGVYLSSSVTQYSLSTARDSVMYRVVTPMLNPFIYTLRNKDLWGLWENSSEGSHETPLLQEVCVFLGL